LERAVVLDRRVVELEKRRDALMESETKPNAAKLEKADDEISRTKKEIQSTLDSIQRLTKAALEPAAPAVPAK
jgi:hypothetical protein